MNQRLNRKDKGESSPKLECYLMQCLIRHDPGALSAKDEIKPDNGQKGMAAA